MDRQIKKSAWHVAFTTILQNGRVDFVDGRVIKIQLHNLGLNESLSAEQTKDKKKQMFIQQSKTQEGWLYQYEQQQK